VPDRGTTTGRQALRPRARLMLTLGLELISSEAVALSELVKNSYDADASTVLIVLRDATPEHPACLTILDDGLGMSTETVTSTWLEPATPSRRRRKVSPAGRRSLGEKGIGRFATAKLARQLELTTRALDGPDEVYLSVDWNAFADEDAYLEDIEVPWGYGPASVFASGGEAAALWRRCHANYEEGVQRASKGSSDLIHGTMIRLDGLRTHWSEEMARDINRTLSRLVSPGADEALEHSERDFRILLDLPPRLAAFSGWLGASDELSRPHYRLRATVDEEGHARIALRIRGEGEWRPPIETVLTGVNGRPPRCGPFSFSLRVWDRDRNALAEIAPDTRFQDFRQVLDQAAGVSVYRDGFRVLPYGELGDDWLRLDRRRINVPTRRLSNNQVVGAINIGRDANPDLVDQTNREGLVEGPALDDLRLLVRELIAQLETVRYEIRPRDPKTSKPKANALEPFQLTELRDVVAARDDSQLIALVSDAQVQLDEHNTEVREVVARYQRLATLGQLVDRMIHEVAQPAVGARQAAVAGLEIIDDSRESASDLSEHCEELMNQLQTEFRVIRKQAGVIADVLGRLAPFGGRRRGRPHTVTVEEAMKDVCRLLRGDIEGRKVSVSIPDSSTAVTVDGTELQEVLLNLVTNSLYWVTRGPRSRARRIALDIERTPDGLSILVSDSGPGVPEGDRERIFDPYFTTREGGVGLGLALAGQIVEDYYGGSLQLISPGLLNGATFQATLRKRVGA
jgi:signal transduction histidine kinase